MNRITPNQASSLSNKRKSRRSVSQSQWAREIRLNNAADDATIPLDLRMKLLCQFGSFSLAYSTAVQPLLRFFGDDMGYIAFRSRWGTPFVLGDPVAAPDRIGNLLDAFIQKYPRAAFCQISQPVAEHLAQQKFWINEFGVDTGIPLKSYTFDGKEKEWLRYAFNWVNRRGYQVVEADFDTINPEEVEQISEDWRKTRTVKSKEVRFLNRPIMLEQETDVRRFFLMDPGGKIESFIFLDPLYRDRQIFGYVTTFKRRHPRGSQYGEQALMKAIIDQLKSESVTELRLGFSPCAWIADSHFNHSRFTRKLFTTIFNSRLSNRWAYNLQGHAAYKRRFRGEEEKVYFASRSWFSFKQLSALVGLCGIA